MRLKCQIHTFRLWVSFLVVSWILFVPCFHNGCFKSTSQVCTYLQILPMSNDISTRTKSGKTFTSVSHFCFRSPELPGPEHLQLPPLKTITSERIQVTTAVSSLAPNSTEQIHRVTTKSRPPLTLHSTQHSRTKSRTGISWSPLTFRRASELVIRTSWA